MWDTLWQALNKKDFKFPESVQQHCRGHNVTQPLKCKVSANVSRPTLVFLIYSTSLFFFVCTLKALTDYMCENFSEGICCTRCIYGRIGKHVQGAGQECKQSVLTDRHSWCWLGEKCVYSEQPDGESSTLTSWAFPGAPSWQRLTLHNFQTRISFFLSYISYIFIDVMSGHIGLLLPHVGRRGQEALHQSSIWTSLSSQPQRSFGWEMCLNVGPAPLVRAFLPTLAVDNDLQLLEVESLRGDGAFSPTDQLRAKTGGTPGLLQDSAPSISALSTPLKTPWCTALVLTVMLCTVTMKVLLSSRFLPLENFKPVFLSGVHWVAHPPLTFL